MAKEDVGSVPVVKDGRLAGVVTDRDIVVRVLAEGRDPTRLRSGRSPPATSRPSRRTTTSTRRCGRWRRARSAGFRSSMATSSSASSRRPTWHARETIQRPDRSSRRSRSGPSPSTTSIDEGRLRPPFAVLRCSPRPEDGGEDDAQGRDDESDDPRSDLLVPRIAASAVPTPMTPRVMATRTVTRSTARVRPCSPAGASRSLFRPNRATKRLYPVGTTALGRSPRANHP